MSPLAALTTFPQLLPLGWTLVLALWHTTLLASIVWAWLRIERRASASRRHGLACGALVCAVVLVSATLWILEHPPAAWAPTSVRHPARDSFRPGPGLPELAESPATASLSTAVIATPSRGVIEWAAKLWLVGAGLLIARLAGGLIVVQSIRARATPVHAGAVREAVSRVGLRLGLRRPVELLESDEIGAPATTGWRRPALIVPSRFSANLSPTLLDPVIVHELEHVRRGDQPIAVLQACVDALFFFCPGALWLSAQVSLAREHRCDDAAIRVCGDAEAYAKALGVLAMGTADRPRAALGVAAPRLADRMRRVLEGDSMPLMNRVQALGLLSGLVAITATGALVLAASLQQIAPGEKQPIPTGYIPQQFGAPITLTRTWATDEYAFAKVRVRNASERRIESITFVAVVEHKDLARPAILVRAAPATVALNPGEAGEVDLSLLPVNDVLEWEGTRGTRAQATLGVIGVGFTDGNSWAIQPQAGARRCGDALHVPEPLLSRARVSAKPPTGPSSAECLDDRGLSYSEGAVVPIFEGGPGFGRCLNGGWIEYDLKAEIPGAAPLEKAVRLRP